MLANTFSEESSGFWTEIKLIMLEKYLERFTTASKRARSTLYLDLFAGSADHTLKDDPSYRFTGSVIRAMETQPKFSILWFFEKSRQKAEALKRTLNDRYPNDQRYDVIVGDCNQTIYSALKRLEQDNLHRSPCFAFIDPYGLNFQWETLAALAKFRRHFRPGMKSHKTELWILFSDPTIPRLAGHDRKQGTDLSRDTTALYGSEAWQAIESRQWMDEVARLSASDARVLYVDLFRYRLHHDLGYKTTFALPIGDTTRRPLYTMIFATDHDAGINIMSSVYYSACDLFANQRGYIHSFQQRQQRESSGVPNLFDVMPTELPIAPLPYENFQIREPVLPNWLQERIDW